MTTNTITITTPAGRSIKVARETARSLEAAGVTPEQIDADIDQIVAGSTTPDQLLAFCLDGSPNSTVEWSDYVGEVARHADSELVRAQTIGAIRARAVNATTRQIAELGLVLSHDEADDLGQDCLDWLRGRLGLTLTETDRGVECRPDVRAP